MENAMKIVLLAVTVIIVAVLIVAAFSLVNSGQSLLSTGKSQINNSMRDYGDALYAQYDAAVIAGTQVISAIKTDWKAENQIATLVCTKDGASYLYDYSGTVSSMCSTGNNDGATIVANLPNDCGGTSLVNGNKLAGGVKISTAGGGGGNAVFKVNTGYNEGAKSQEVGFITRNADFRGTISRDRNGNIRLLTFVQQ